MLRDEVRLRHMLDAALLARGFISGVDRTTFDQNIGLQFQVIRALEIIGEAATGVSEAFKQAHSNLPWSQMSRMRNRLIHAYFNVDLEIVWRTLEVDLPTLIPELQQLLQQTGTEESS